MDEDERDGVSESAILDDTALSRRLGLRWRYRRLYEHQLAELSRAQENFEIAVFPFQKNKWRYEIAWRQQLSLILKPYVALTQEEQELEAQGKLKALQIVPQVTSDKLMIGVASSDLPPDLVLFYLAFLAANGVETWEAALRLDTASPCFEGLPSVLVMRLLSVIDRLQRDDVQAAAATCYTQHAVLSQRLQNARRFVVVTAVELWRRHVHATVVSKRCASVAAIVELRHRQWHCTPRTPPGLMFRALKTLALGLTWHRRVPDGPVFRCCCVLTSSSGAERHSWPMSMRGAVAFQQRE
ncbi:hypothetical protein JKP88DRAFT_245013 [Tribonema minus]|uniref:Uncharacterized protein n=1 Tax=Tribonema minus TaxID=303371 RepID=A0A836CF33_9STRA|nr:hypothetical protein JKP88DRAFT_245013 [Tribonema minus]